MKELERKRFQEAKIRLKEFVLSYGQGGPSDEEQSLEQMRLLRYYKHRFCTFIQIMKEAVTARRVKGPQKKAAV